MMILPSVELRCLLRFGSEMACAGLCDLHCLWQKAYSKLLRVFGSIVWSRVRLHFSPVSFYQEQSALWGTAGE